MEKENFMVLFEIGSKQYCFKRDGHLIDIDFKKGYKSGDKLIFDRVMVYGDRIGTPFLNDISVIGTVINPSIKGKKIHIMKYKPKKRQIHRKGHRKISTRVSLEVKKSLNG